MRTELAVSRLEVTPGEPATIDVTVTNTSDVIDGITAVVDGIDPTWVELVVPVVSLFPQTTGSLSVRIDMPKDCPAGDYLVVVKVVSTIDAGRHDTRDFWLTVLPHAALALALRPSLITAGSTATFDAVLSNVGNIPIDVALAARDDARLLDCTTAVGAVLLAPGEVAAVTVRAKGRRPWFGQTAARSIVVTATSGDIELEELATFNQKPLIPRGALTIAMLAGIIALWATIFLLVVRLLGERTDPTKAVATNFNTGGAQDVSLAAVAAAVGGTVSAETTGEGLARVTVEAYRVKPDGAEELTSSAATGDDGAYALPILLPGDYKLRFTAEGFDEVWSGGVPDSAAASLLSLEPTDRASGVDVQMKGGTGALRGALVAGDGTTSPPIVVSVRRLPENAPPVAPGVSEAPAPEILVIETTGELVLDGLATPATYIVRVESPGFEAQEFEETLAGGETKVLNTVRLGAAVGSLSGQVTSSDGQPLGAVKVEVSSGEFIQELTTPTAGNVGTFVAQNLKTPGTYVVTFTLEGFSSATVALELGPGEARADVNATLVGGTGSMRGTVTALDGTPLGGVAVHVQKGTFVADTATLTTGAGDTGPGSFAVDSIPTPGTYTVTFTKAGFLTEARQVTFATAGPQQGVDAVLRSARASVQGRVTGAGAPLTGATVALDDGRAIRQTPVATSPPGAYSFTDVAPGSYTLTVVHPNFAPRILLVTVVAGDVLTQDVALPPPGTP